VWFEYSSRQLLCTHAVGSTSRTRRLAQDKAVGGFPARQTPNRKCSPILRSFISPPGFWAIRLQWYAATTGANAVGTFYPRSPIAARKPSRSG
jgi:hypothetical protein